MQHRVGSVAESVDVSTNPRRDAGTGTDAVEPDALEEFRRSIAYLLGAISNILSASASRFYRQHFAIGLAEWRLMWVLAIEPAITARRASQIMGLDKAAVSRAVAGLERRGLLQAAPDPADNRQRLIELSPAGTGLYRRMIVVSRERQRRILAPLSNEEQRVLAALLGRLHAHLARSDDADRRAVLAESDPGAA
jgi:DNA-binding MarR family transcriptional regulator